MNKVFIIVPLLAVMAAAASARHIYEQNCLQDAWKSIGTGSVGHIQYAVEEKTAQTLLIRAAEKRDYKCAEFLMQNKARPEVQDKLGRDARFYAKGDPKMIGILSGKQ